MKKISGQSMKDLSNAEFIPIGTIMCSHISKQLTIKGKIISKEFIEIKAIEIAFQCLKCEFITCVQQPVIGKSIKPYKCKNDLCQRKGPFKMIPKKSTLIDEQRLVLQDVGDPNHDIIVIVRGLELINITPEVETYVTINGIVRVIQKGRMNQFDYVFEAKHIEKND